MTDTTVDQMLAQPVFDRYVQIVGYCHRISKPAELRDPSIIESEKPFFSDLILSVKPSTFTYEDMKKKDVPIIVISEWKSNLVEKIMKKNNLVVGKIRIVAKFKKVGSRVTAEHVLKVDLLGEHNVVTDSAQQGQSVIPKELRGKI